MHQYTADLANRAAAFGHDVHLVSTVRMPAGRYAPQVAVHTPVDTHSTGFSPDDLRLMKVRGLSSGICALEPDVVHFTGPHLWNVPLVRSLVRAGLPVVHTLHDLDPHGGAAYGSLLYAWNALILRSGAQILVHSRGYRERLIAQGLPPARVSATPLLHLFVGYETRAQLRGLELQAADGVSAEMHLSDTRPWALFFGRLERYKGLGDLLQAYSLLAAVRSASRLVVAGPGSLNDLWSGPLPAGVDLRDHLIGDEESIDLFTHCGLVVLPYRDATQSALVAAAYYFRKPVLVTAVGALPEYVEDGLTGRVVAPGKPAELARCLAEMLSDPARLAAMGEAGRAWYDRQRVEETHLLFDLYQNCGIVKVSCQHESRTVSGLPHP